MKSKIWIFIVVIVLIALFLIFTPLKKYTYDGFFFDTYVRIKIYERNPIKARRAIQLIIDEFKRIDNIPVNDIKGKNVDTTQVQIIKASLEISKKTEGAFDPTVDVILKKWNYFKEPTKPEQKVLDSMLLLVNYKEVNINYDSLLLTPGMSLTLGGSAKGYALNRARTILEKNGISSGLVEAGGDILLVGKKKNKEDWIIGVRDPREQNGIIGVCKLYNCYIATSGDYERYFFIDGVRYHHIINPQTGYPAREMQSVTVIGKDGLVVDALSTAIFAMGMKKAEDFIKKYDIEAVIVDSSGKIHNFTYMFTPEELWKKD
jgi:thiamine biosynthesis lipoprotein